MLNIRPYHHSDQKELLEIFNFNVPKHFAPHEVAEFIGYLEIKSKTYLTIEFENKIIGGVGYEMRASDKSGRINWIFLHPDFSNKGYGKKAVEYCLAILKADPAVDILIVRTYQLAYQFFEKLGYGLIKIEKDYWAPGFDLYLMEQIINK